MPTIEFTSQGHSALLGAFSAGDRKTVSEAEAAHFVDEAMAAVRVVAPAAEPEPAPAVAEEAPAAKPARKPKAGAA
jgi:outer membrane biosynthesis protein TonB